MAVFVLFAAMLQHRHVACLTLLMLSDAVLHAFCQVGQLDVHASYPCHSVTHTLPTPSPLCTHIHWCVCMVGGAQATLLYGFRSEHMYQPLLLLV